MGDVGLVDTMIKDGLTDVFNNYHMGITAENLAEQYQVTRDDQDAFATASQNKASAARAAGRFRDEIAPVTVKTRKGETIVENDEYIRDGVEQSGLAGLRPAFKKDGTVTAANASGLNDGAAALVLMSREEAERRGAPILARVASWASAGVDPSIMGIGPVPASKKALEKAGWTIADLDLIEANEAFAAQALAVGKELGWDADQGQRQRRRHRHRPPDRRLGRARPHHPDLRDAEARRQEGPRHAVHRRRHGHRGLRRARLTPRIGAAPERSRACTVIPRVTLRGRPA